MTELGDPGPLEPSAEEIAEAPPPRLGRSVQGGQRALCAFCDALGPEDGTVPGDWFLDKWMRAVCPRCAHAGKGEWA